MMPPQVKPVANLGTTGASVDIDVVLRDDPAFADAMLK
jgi:hypothetical protein